MSLHIAGGLLRLHSVVEGSHNCFARFATCCVASVGESLVDLLEAEFDEERLHDKIGQLHCSEEVAERESTCLNVVLGAEVERLLCISDQPVFKSLGHMKHRHTS